MRVYNRTRYAQMTEEQKKTYLSINMERNRVRKARAYAERKEYEKMTTKEMSEDVQKLLMKTYEKDRRPTREVLNDLAAETGMFWMTIRVRICDLWLEKTCLWHIFLKRSVSLL